MLSSLKLNILCAHHHHHTKRRRFLKNAGEAYKNVSAGRIERREREQMKRNMFFWGGGEVTLSTVSKTAGQDN